MFRTIESGLDAVGVPFGDTVADASEMERLYREVAGEMTIVGSSAGTGNNSVGTDEGS